MLYRNLEQARILRYLSARWPENEEKVTIKILSLSMQVALTLFQAKPLVKSLTSISPNTVILYQAILSVL